MADATVILLERHFVMHNERQRTHTNSRGNFRFSGNDNHSLQLEARPPGSAAPSAASCGYGFARKT